MESLRRRTQQAFYLIMINKALLNQSMIAIGVLVICCFPYKCLVLRNLMIHCIGEISETGTILCALLNIVF